MCAGNELFFCMLYLLHFTSGPICKYYYNNLFLSSLLMQTTLLKTPNTCSLDWLCCHQKITILILQRVKWPFWGGRGSYRAKVQSHTGISSGVFFFFKGGGGGEEGGCSESFQKRVRVGYGYFLEQHNMVKLCKKFCSVRVIIWICSMYSEIYKRPYIEWFSGSPTILGVLLLMMRILWSPEFIIIIYFPIILLL